VITGIYGSELPSFPEQHQEFKWWKASAQFNDGWTLTTNPVLLYGIFHNYKSGIANSNNMTISYSHYFLWCSEEMDDGDFIQWQGVTYRILHDNNWTTQNGYTQYLINKVVGSNGTNQVDPVFSSGGSKM